MVKTSLKKKREINRLKKEKVDNLTNLYIINLAWGIFIIILLRFIENGFFSPATMLEMPIILKVFAGIFAVLIVAMGVCAGLNIKGQKKRFLRYLVFFVVLMIGSLWIGFYSSIRNIFIEINQEVFSNIDSRWWYSRGPIVAVACYLVITLIITTIRIALIEKGKK